MLESPLRGKTEDAKINLAYAQRALEDSLRRNEAPFVSHLLYTQVLDDDSYFERRIGIDCGNAWLLACRYLVVYLDLGITEGMSERIELAKSLGIPVVERRIL